MRKITLLEILDAGHLSKHVDAPSSFRQRGGIMIVGPPATLKTTFIKNVYDEHYDALVIGDINIQTLKKLRDEIRSERYNTLAFPEYEKLYQRRADTAANLEGCIKQLVEEGFSKFSFEDVRMSSGHAHALVIGAITTAFYERKYEGWDESGFLRRFIWCNITLSNRALLMDSISKWQPLEFGSYRTRRVPGNKFIPYALDEQESEKIRNYLKEQPGQETPFVLLKKIACVLKWKYEKGEPGKAMDIIKDFSEALRSNVAAKIDLEESLEPNGDHSKRKAATKK